MLYINIYKFEIIDANQGNVIAKMYVGHCLMYGIGVETKEAQANCSSFTEEDLCQLFWDLGDALENSLGVFRNYRVTYYYFNMLDDWEHPEDGERKKKLKKFLWFWYKVK